MPLLFVLFLLDAVPFYTGSFVLLVVLLTVFFIVGIGHVQEVMDVSGG